MLPSEDFGLVPKFGVEIEIVKWKKRLRREVCEELVQEELMSAEGKFDQQYHNYHCKCRVCQAWNTGKVPWPVQTIQQYDASLPEDGGEFITSPMLCTELFMQGFRDVWDVVVRGAEWTTSVPNRRGGPSSPSVHVHVSVENPFKEVINARLARQALWGYLPELFKIAGVCGTDRGVEFRHPDPDVGHHSAINIRLVGEDGDPIAINPDFLTKKKKAPAASNMRLEWRIWEAAYTDWPYTEGVIALSCALTQLVANRDMAKLLATSAALLDNDSPYDVTDAETTEEILALYSSKRFSFLTEIVLNAPLVQEDPAIYNAIAALFARVERP